MYVGLNSKGKNSIAQSHYHIRELQNISIVTASVGSFENVWKYFLMSEIEDGVSLQGHCCIAVPTRDLLSQCPSRETVI